MIELTHKTIDSAAVTQSVQDPSAGAIVLFLGTVREVTAREDAGRRVTASLEYECYAEMAEKKLAELEADARKRWPLLQCAIIHRLGMLPVGETSVAIAVSSAHRRVAFEAGQWLIDRIKEVVPIWKKENYADGTSDWVHPGADDATRGDEPNPNTSNNLET
ncbi:MAG: molybdenum cofactor biosynthesis protein MoaE [Thermoguttaceae bacterium]